MQFFCTLHNLFSYELRIQTYVKFMINISDQEKSCLLNSADCLIYTPMNEHFGIVPLEAMACGTPVIAMNSGGPIETVGTNKKVGILVAPDKNREKLAQNTADAIKEVLANHGNYVSNCKERVQNMFSFDAFSDQLNRIVNSLVIDKKKV